MARPDPLAPLASAPSSSMAPEAAERLSVQLSTLSELLETITYRLLELEERVAAQDLKIQGLEEQLLDPAAVASGLSDDAELRLEDTEERLSQLEALLNGMGSPAGAAAARHLQPVPHQVEEMVASDDPFPEEGEQPFMDELDGDPDDHLEETA